ncbi:hypothetical protein BC831DRAFT_458914 [Entophlyctis helioformis]|nr:hypothetical protein BC831DRAFT_458914 [Entophlyctis helioformis]
MRLWLKRPWRADRHSEDRGGLLLHLLHLLPLLMDQDGGRGPQQSRVHLWLAVVLAVVSAVGIVLARVCCAIQLPAAARLCIHKDIVGVAALPAAVAVAAVVGNVGIRQRQPWQGRVDVHRQFRQRTEK